ncbi:MAG: hypothetical protein IPK50_13410 [Fibrobacterota bacterium]|nr:hypothetical protein [Fibrobacterota bacterium]QQS03305.1 MAG: hypothetical protein IPK50_13410 [Fibrobacterota bacterium]
MADQEPLAWAESIHGSLVLLPIEDVDSFELVEQSVDLEVDPLVEGVVGTMDVGAGINLVLAKLDSATLLPVEEGAVLLQPLEGPSFEEDAEVTFALVDGIPASAWKDSGLVLPISEGLALFDSCAPDFEAIEEAGVFVELPEGEYAVETILGYRSSGLVANLMRFRLI